MTDGHTSRENTGSAPAKAWRSQFPGRELMDVRFQRPSQAEHVITWKSANPETTVELRQKLDAVAGLVYSCDSNEIKPGHTVDTITISGEDNLRKFVAAGGKFPASTYYEAFPAERTIR